MADRVLVVDDEQSLSKVLAATLQREGYEVQVASDGEVAAMLAPESAAVPVTVKVVVIVAACAPADSSRARAKLAKVRFISLIWSPLISSYRKVG